MKLNFNVYVGGKGKTVDRTGLAAVPTPEPSGRWHPIPHMTLVDELEKALIPHQMKIVGETFKLDKDGQRMFGMLQVANCKADGDFGFAVGLRNAHDKMIKAGLAVGMGVMVCSNLSFRGEIVIGRKHTTEILADLPLKMKFAMHELSARWDKQTKIVEAYKNTDINKHQAHDLLITCAHKEVFPRTQLMDIIDEFDAPTHPEFKDRNLWSLFNAVTEHLKPRESSSGSTLWLLPTRTQSLHSILDPVAGIPALSPEEETEGTLAPIPA
jgi:hypothetical protein